MADSKRAKISKREGALMARLSAKEQEVYEIQASARDLYRARRPVTDFARQVYTDPAINVEFQLLTAQLAEMENSLRLKEAELKELRTTADKADKAKASAGKAPDKAAGGGATGDASGSKSESTAARASGLVARCQRLEQENEELAASADVAKVAQLTGEKAVAEAYAGDLKNALEEAYEYIEQLEEEREVHSNKVYALEEELRSTMAQNRPYDQHQQHQQRHQEPERQHEQQHHQQPHQQPHQQQQHQQQQQRQQRDRPDHHPDQQQQQQQPQHQQEHHEHGGEGERGGMREGTGGGGGGEERRGRNRSSSYGHDAPPPPPPPPDSSPDGTPAADDDMDDLYGDMGMGDGDGVGGEELLPAGGEGGVEESSGSMGSPRAAVKDDPMQQDDQDHAERVRREEVPPAPPTRARSSRRSTRNK